MTDLNKKQMMNVFNDLAEKVRQGSVQAAQVQDYLTQQIIHAPEALREVYREAYKTVFPDAKIKN